MKRDGEERKKKPHFTISIEKKERIIFTLNHHHCTATRKKERKKHNNPSPKIHHHFLLGFFKSDLWMRTAGVRGVSPLAARTPRRQRCSEVDWRCSWPLGAGGRLRTTAADPLSHYSSRTGRCHYWGQNGAKGPRRN